MREPFVIRRVAVLGAGVMGAQIAAHCVNAGFETLLYDLAADEKNHNAVVENALKNLKKLKPSPLGTATTVNLLQPKNYQDDLEALRSCDLVIEAIAERLDWKKDLYYRIAPYVNDKAAFVSNTSGLSINTLAKSLPQELQARFCGVHFFNPPRYMHLAELIPAQTTSKGLLDYLESWLTSYLGKGVIRAFDTPNFIANRIGVFSLLSTMYNAQKMEIGLDTVDALTGAVLGRPKSATFRTMDVVGLDTMAHVIRTMQQQLSDDPWHKYFTMPTWLMALIESGHLGQKSGQGIYRKVGRSIEVYDLKSAQYRPAQSEISTEVQAILNIKDPAERMEKLQKSGDTQAQFLLACLNDLFHYSAYHLQGIAETVRDVDLAMRWGFGWQQGPFETWQLSHVESVKNNIVESIKAGRTMSEATMPSWLDGLQSFYMEEGAWSPANNAYIPRRDLPVYQRQFFPDRVLREKKYPTETLYENDAVRLWHLKDDVAIISFKTKANTIGQAVLDGFNEALDRTLKSHKGLIVYQEDANNFSSGADLRGVASLIEAGEIKALESMIEDFQALAMRIKYCTLPIVAALRGRALGGGCELMMHCDRIVAGFESYPGLVESGVGVIPAGGGCKELALRAAEKAGEMDVIPHLRHFFEQTAMATVSMSAADAKVRGFLRSADSILMHKNEVLYAALAEVQHLVKTNYLPPLPKPFKVAGREGHAMLQTGLVNWLEGGFISKHDYYLANQLAKVLCGGEVNEGTLIDEDWMLKLEKEAFINLVQTKETQERIKHLLETGKPLRN